MTSPIAPATAGTSTRPYLIRALHDWCTDNGFTPYIAVFVDDHVQVPKEYVKNNEIVLNVGFEATSALKLGNELIEFKARFGGTSREIAVPIDHVIAIYARENGQGMAFPMPSDAAGSDAADAGKPESPGASARGPRLAGPTGAGGRKGGTALTLSPSPRSNPEPPSEPPPPSVPPTPKRPSLKRVK
ncbi:MAG TPA: ClpXP protease specificity-enhancing factor [Caldimonas sp.]|jgi:stringent starvation protein B|nr:ClpXP protease specificity-enhancing factor [Caldimonas sp.]